MAVWFLFSDKQNKFLISDHDLIKWTLTNLYVYHVRCILNFALITFEIFSILILIALMWARIPLGPDKFERVIKYHTIQTSFHGGFDSLANIACSFEINFG